MRITSLTNARVAQIRDLHTTKGRKKSGLLLMEGPHLLKAMLAVQISPTEIYFQPELLQRTPEGQELLASLQKPDTALTGTLLIEISERVAEALGDAQTSQGVLCLLPVERLGPELLLAKRSPMQRPALLILDDLADPGNLGTILRTALAADVQEVLLTPHCADCYSPKVVRAAAGAHLALPVRVGMSWSAIRERVLQHCANDSERVFVADAGGTLAYFAAELTAPFALIIGNEAHGPSREARALAKHVLSIPLANNVESLNAAMAAGILLFEAVRQLQRS